MNERHETHETHETHEPSAARHDALVEMLRAEVQATNQCIDRLEYSHAAPNPDAPAILRAMMGSLPALVSRYRDWRGDRAFGGILGALYGYAALEGIPGCAVGLVESPEYFIVTTARGARYRVRVGAGDPPTRDTRDAYDDPDARAIAARVLAIVARTGLKDGFTASQRSGHPFTVALWSAQRAPYYLTIEPAGDVASVRAEHTDAARTLAVEGRAEERAALPAPASGAEFTRAWETLIGTLQRLQRLQRTQETPR